MIARFLLAALLALLQAATVAWAADTATSKSAGWQRARVVFTADNPTAVAIDRERLYVLVAPFLRGVKDGTSGIVGIDRSTGATTTLLRSTPTLLPNHLAEVQADATRLYWLNGLAIMATDKASGQTRLLAAPGSSAMTLHGGTLYSFNYDNKRTLTAIDAATGRVTDLAPLPLLASRIAADAAGVLLMVTPSTLPTPPGVVRWGAAERALQTLVVVENPTQVQLRAMVPYALPEDAARGRFTGFYFVERDVRANRASVKRFTLATRAIETLAVNRIDELRPMRADVEALYFFAAESNAFDSAFGLFRLPHDGGPPRLLDRGYSPPMSLQVEGGRVYWSDARSVYELTPAQR